MKSFEHKVIEIKANGFGIFVRRVTTQDVEKALAKETAGGWRLRQIVTFGILGGGTLMLLERETDGSSHG